MKKIIYFGILLFLSIHTGLLSQHLGTNTGDAIKQGTPSLPPNISPACIDETAVPVAPCCDVKIPSNYVRGAGDRVIISEGMTFVYNQLLGIWEWAPAQPVYIFTGYWNYYSKIISTNPDAPYNLERTWTNKFDWRKPTIRGWFPNYGGVWGGPAPLEVLNPYFDRNSKAISYFSLFKDDTTLIADPEKMDFHPRDGWEVLHRHLGYQPDEVTLEPPTSSSIHYPYYTLYNRYTGKIRHIATLPDLPGQQLLMTLKHNPLLSSSGLFNSYNAGGVHYALDKKTKTNAVSSPTVPSDDPQSWVGGDFQTSYDPCVCNHESELRFEYSKVQTSDLYLEGRIVGTNVPLDNGGDINQTLQNGQDFLWAVSRDGFSVKGGMQTYFNINKLVDRYKAPPEIHKSFGELLKEGMIGLLKTGIGAAVGGLDGWLGKQADKLLRGLIPKKNVYTNVQISAGGGVNANGSQYSYNYSQTNTTRVPIIDPEKLKIGGLGLAGLGTSFLNTQLFPDNTTQRPAIPNISFLEAEGIFRGKATTLTPYSTSILLATPGAKNSNNPNRPWITYPFYNEALGVFAVLNTPKIDTELDKISYQGSNVKRYKFSFREDLKYTFNPAAQIDERKTQITASLIVRVPKSARLSSGDLDNLMLVSEGNGENATDVVYQSAFFPLSCLSKQIARITVFDRDGAIVKPTLQLRFMIKTVTVPAPPYHKVNYGLQIYTFHAESNPVSYQTLVGDLSSYSISASYINGYNYINDYTLSGANWNLSAKDIILVKTAKITKDKHLCKINCI